MQPNPYGRTDRFEIKNSHLDEIDSIPFENSVEFIVQIRPTKFRGNEPSAGKIRILYYIFGGV